MSDRKHLPPAPFEPAAPDDARMDAVLRSCGIRLSALQLRQIWAYHSLLRERNPDLNLTRVRNFTNMVIKLYADSMLPADMVELPSPLLDLGTGPGMPGIPLKIYRPQIEVVLAESRSKRVAFLHAAVARLGLEGVSVVGSRISPFYEEPVAGVITRAVEPMEETLERVRGCLAAGGPVVFMKGPRCNAEIERARSRFETLFAPEMDRAYRIPGTRHERRLVVFRRLDEPLHARRAGARIAHPPHALTSDRNPIFKDLKKLLTGRGIRKRSQALVSGPKTIAEILARQPESCEAWLSRDDRMPPPPASPAHLKWIQLAPPLFAELDTAGTNAPMLLIRLPDIRPWTAAEEFPPGLSLLIPFQDPENVGAAIRSAAAFGAAQVILLSECAHPFHPKALRASGGAAMRIRLRQGPALQDLPEDIPVFAISAEGEDIRQAAFPAAFGLLAGMEGPGLPPAWRRRALRVPISPEVESLNAAVAVSVALYEWRNKGNSEGGRWKAELKE